MILRSRRVLATGLLLVTGPLLLHALPARSDWTNDSSQGVLLESVLGLTPRLFCLPDSGSGALLLDAPNVPHGGLPGYAQRADHWGQIRWGAGVNPLNGNGWYYGALNGPAACPDGSGGILYAWVTDTVRFGRVTAGGQVPLTANGVKVEMDSDFLSETASFPRVVADGAGGAVVVWLGTRQYADGTLSMLFAQRLDASGTPQWSADVPLCAASTSVPILLYWMSAVPDGSGGAFVFWSQTPLAGGDPKIYMQRVDGTGTLRMAAPGVRLCTTTGTQNGPLGTDTYHWEGLEAVSDGAGGAIVVWADSRADAQLDLYAQRVGPTGTRLWTSTGVPACTQPGAQDVPRTASDGASGVIAIWQDFSDDASGDIYAQRVDASGAIPASWPARGLAVTVRPGVAQSEPCIAADGAGGAYVAWLDARSGQREVYAQRLSPNGYSLWLPEGFPDGIPAHMGASGTPRIVRADAVHAIIAFTCDFCGCPYGYDVRANRVPFDWPASVPERPRATLAVRAVPNPAGGAGSIAFTLPEARPARLEMIDPAGRRVWARDVSAWGVGEHTLALDPPTLAPGLYWLRLTQGGRSAQAKLVRMR